MISDPSSMTRRQDGGRAAAPSLLLSPSPSGIDPWRALGIALFYAACLTEGHFNLLRPTGIGLTFNSMLAHLLRGQFDVDPAAIGMEGFVRDGRTYAYFGVLPALLRLPLILLGRLGDTDITRLSVLAATVTGTLLNLRSVAVIRRHARSSALTDMVILTLSVAVVLGGAGLAYLKASIYQEAVSWAYAIACAFVFLSLRGLMGERAFDRGLLARLALLAGAALLTRVSTGLGLYLALGLLSLVLAAREAASDGERRPFALRFLRHALAPRIILPIGILLGFIGITGVINYFRWGNPLTFADLHLNLIYQYAFPDRLPRLERYGEFNLARIGYGLMYYFFPIWVVIDSAGKFLFQDFQQRLVESAELPPSSFLVSDPLLIILSALFLRALWRGEAAVRRLAPQALALLAGLAVPAFLMLIAISMTFRYRMEFYPLLELAAFLGAYSLCAPETAASAVDRRLIRLLPASAVLGAVASYFLMICYQISPFGPATGILPLGWLRFYYWQFNSAFLGVAH